MSTRLSRGVKHLREQGPVSVMRWGLVRAEAVAWERYFAVETKRDFDHGERPDNSEGVRPEPVPWCLARAAMDVLPMSRSDVLLDYGCGIGRLLIMAARREVNRVIGVESHPALAQLAQKNVVAASARLRSPVELVVADAATWEVPDDVTVAVLFNPCVEAEMAATQLRLTDSLRRRQRRLRILYAHATTQPNVFEGCPWFRLEKRLDVGAFVGTNILLYESRPMPLFMIASEEEGIAPLALGGPNETSQGTVRLSISEGWLTEVP